MKPSLFASGKECSALALVTLAALMPLTLIHASTDAPQGGILYFVNTTSDTVVIGACQNGNPGCSLRGAIQTANSHPGADGISIDLPPGSIINLTSALPDLTESVDITGAGANVMTVRRDTGGSYRIFNVTFAAVATFTGLTISNGVGGINNNNAAAVNVINSTLSGNATASGLGGGIYNNSDGIVNVTNSTLNGNSAGAGGAIFNNSAGTVNVTNSNMFNNTANSSGGGGVKNNSTGTVNVINSSLSANSSIGGSGGGIYNSTGTLNVINSTFYFNGTQNGSSGGGIFNNTGTVTVTNSTLSGNTLSSGGTGGAIFNLNGNVTVQSSIIALNRADANPDVSGDFISLGFNIIGARDGSTGFTTQPTDQTGTVASPLDPKLDPHGAQGHGGSTETIALLVGSPAIDKGDNALTNLSNAINNSTTSINVIAGNRIPAKVGYVILVDSEKMVVTTKASNTLTVTRGTNGTTAAPHSQGAIVGSAFDQRGTGFPRGVDYLSIPNASGDGTDIGAIEFGGPLVPISVSRKMHGASAFDINLPLETFPAGLECRSGGASGNHQLVLTFPSPVTVGGAGTNGIGSVSNFSVSGNVVTVNLTGVANAQRDFTTILFDVSDGTNMGEVGIPMDILLGDTSSNGTVNATDVSQTKLKSGQAVDASNFREDVNVNGVINSSDVSTVKLKSGTALP